MKKFFKLLGPKLSAILFLCLLLLIIGLPQNLEPANVRVLFWTFLEILSFTFSSLLSQPGLILELCFGHTPRAPQKSPRYHRSKTQNFNALNNP
ncbi:MAG: hypothetical protein R3B54_11775 [Bdellovibrionota bacterium]